MHSAVAIAPVRRGLLALLAAIAGAPAWTAPAQAAGSAGSAAARGSAQLYSATLMECVPSSIQAERSATFAGEMTAIPGSMRMAVRIDLQEMLPGEGLFHTVVAPGLGVWRASDSKVKVYRYLKQVTDLSSPAEYRARVRFRWLAPGGRVIRRAQLITAGCQEPASPASPPPSITAAVP